MTPEEKARAYAEKKTENCVSEYYGSMKRRRRVVRFDSYDIEQAYLAGTTEALASQWVSVEERLPEYNSICLVRGQEDDRRWWMHFAWFDGENFYDAQTDRLYRPLYWLSIPPLKGGEA